MNESWVFWLKDKHYYYYYSKPSKAKHPIRFNRRFMHKTRSIPEIGTDLSRSKRSWSGDLKVNYST